MQHWNMRMWAGVAGIVGVGSMLGAGDAPRGSGGATWYAGGEARPVLCVPMGDKAPVLDGKLDDAVWKTAARIDRLEGAGGGDAGPSTSVRVAADGTNLYVAFECVEPQMDKVKVKAQAGEDKWPGDVVEVFIDYRRSEKEYYQFVTNHVDAHNDYGPGGAKSWNGKWQSKAGKTPTGWVTEIAIPWTDLGGDGGHRGEEWGFNVTRERLVISDSADTTTEIMSTWAPMANFGNARLFGDIFLGTAEARAQRKEPMKLRATLDRFVYSTLQPVGHLAVQLERGKLEGGTLAWQVRAAGDKKEVQKNQVAIGGPRGGVQIPLQELAPGDYEFDAWATDAQGLVSNHYQQTFAIKAAEPAVTSGEIAIRQTEPVGQAVGQWHVTTGVPFPEGVLWDPRNVQLEIDGKAVPVQADTLATWSLGGSVKWLALNYQMPLAATKLAEAKLKFGKEAQKQQAGRIAVQDGADVIAVDTGAARFEIRKRGFNLLERMWVGEKLVLDHPGGPRGLYMADEAGAVYWAELDPAAKVEVEETGSMRTVVRAEGAHADGQGKTLGRYVARFYFYSGVPYFRMQHTFIITEDSRRQTYSDIGVRLPVVGADYAFGGESAAYTGKLAEHKSVSLLQRKWNDFVVKANDPGEAKSAPLQQGKKAPGWLARGNVAVAVRDFWQNFPKELEATPDALIVHLWPGHGERVWSEKEESTADVAWRLPFAHQGKLLDFRIPEPYYTGELAQMSGFAYPDGKGGWKLHYGETAKEANAMGLAKTHELLVALGDAAQPEKFAPLQAAFQEGVHFLSEPKWNAATQVVGVMPEADAKTFPAQEEFVRTGFEFLTRWTLDLTEAYGMFNYGDSYHGMRYDTPNLLPVYYRLWAGYHHARARVPWLFYLRSGEPQYLHWGNINAQHLTDIDICHYTTDAYDKAAIGQGHKVVGGLCDYKGYVHWNQGARVGEYNNMIDFLYLDWYLTGNLRVRDVMHEMGQALIARGKAYPSREGAGMLSATFDYYKATWDPRALSTFVNELPKMYGQPAHLHNPPSIGWAPYLEPWIQWSGDEKAKEFLLAFCADVMNRELQPLGYDHYGDGRAFAEAYRLTGDRKYLLHAWAYYNKGMLAYENPNDPLNHLTDWLNYSFESQQMFPVMYYLRQAGPIPKLADVPYITGGPLVNVRDRKNLAPVVVQLIEKSDAPMQLQATLWSRKPIPVELVAPNGEVAFTTTVDTKGDFLLWKQQVPADGQTGTYELRFKIADDFQIRQGDFCTGVLQRYVMGPKSENDFIGKGRWFFYVPADCESFKFTFQGPVREAGDVAAVAVMSPEDREVARKSLPYRCGLQTLEVKPPAEMRGKVWALMMSEVPIVDMEGIPRYFATSAEGAKP